jgi:hydroxymethylbilane synthase
VIGCYPEREDPRDVLISHSGLGLLALAPGSVVGTSSLRRRIQLEAARPDLSVTVLRGNVDTRLRKCRERQVDAILLARAGLVRLGLADQVTEDITPEVMLPAVGQGALGIEHRAADPKISALLAPLNHSETKIAVLTERAALRAVEGSCQMPVAAYAIRDGGQMHVRGLLAEPDGSRLRRAELRVPWPETEALAESVGAELGQALKR